MARIRSIFPGLWTDEAFAFLPDAAALIFIGLWNECDDNGIFEWKPSTLKMKLRPGKPETPADVEAHLSELASAGLVRQFEIDGRKYGAVRNFAKWQRPKTPNGMWPLPDDVRKCVGLNDDGTRPNAGTGRRSTKVTSEPLPNSPGTTSEESPLREEGGDTREEEQEPLSEPVENFPSTAPSQASGAVEPESLKAGNEGESEEAVGAEDESLADVVKPALYTPGDPKTAEPSRARAEDEDSLEPPAILDRRRYPEAFEELWREYRPIAEPNATKADAHTAWKRLSAADREACWSGLVRYVLWLQERRLKRTDYPAKHLSTFINRRGWESFEEEAA